MAFKGAMDTDDLGMEYGQHTFTLETPQKKSFHSEKRAAKPKTSVQTGLPITATVTTNKTIFMSVRNEGGELERAIIKLCYSHKCIKKIVDIAG